MFLVAINLLNQQHSNNGNRSNKLKDIIFGVITVMQQWRMHKCMFYGIKISLLLSIPNKRDTFIQEMHESLIELYVISNKAMQKVYFPLKTLKLDNSGGRRN
jgi:hypothetical protein